MGNANTGTKERRMPKRIILVRHGESEGNVDKNVYATVPDHKVQLTKKGKEQAKKAGELIRGVVGNNNCKVYFYNTGFVESLWRDIDMDKIPHSANDNLNIVIISHGPTVGVLLVRFFRWTAEQVENLTSPKNAVVRIMELGHEGEYTLALYHDDQTLEKWGLSPEMIVDQKQRAFGHKVDLDKCFFTSYFEKNNV
ncbi:phosphoglycerate mutase-like protein AT74 [Lycium barbarum]|uniref:phosphoglycerate mutase-like protein AT74 n=1 Tax=Lycium barbarum TaxID=112863 RepID=UPI00293EDC9D|nr:phosphoglycerate mutase-like protein AT74 [Lycium barbarum]